MVSSYWLAPHEIHSNSGSSNVIPHTTSSDQVTTATGALEATKASASAQNNLIKNHAGGSYKKRLSKRKHNGGTSVPTFSNGSGEMGANATSESVNTTYSQANANAEYDSVSLVGGSGCGNWGCMSGGKKTRKHKKNNRKNTKSRRKMKHICSVKSCKNKVHKNRKCKKHYKANKKSNKK
jgi:hypothetical protein